MTTPQLLSHFETCPRKALYSRQWAAPRLSSQEILQQTIRSAMLETERTDIGEVAGEAVMELAETRGLEVNTLRVYQSATHHAALSDVVASAIRKPSDAPWAVPDPLPLNWVSGALLDPTGAFLRGILVVSTWNPDREVAEAHSWYTLGEVCHYQLPMQLVVVVAGVLRDGRRHSPWTKGILHPANHALRFKKRPKGMGMTSPFADSWKPVWREDVGGTIPTGDWLNAMLEDNVLHEHLFTIKVPVPGEVEAQRIRDLAQQKLETIATLDKSWSGRPPKNLSSCWWPQKCPFTICCWNEKLGEQSPKDAGFTPRT